MLRIRFFRVGKKKQPSFKIVVTDKRRPPSGGRFVEEVGFLNPLTKEKNLKAERIKYWISKGAKPSDSVYNLLIKEKVLEGKKIPLHKTKKKKKEVKEEIKKEAKEVKKKEIKEEVKPEEIKPEEVKPEEKKEEKPKESKPEEKKEEAKPEEAKEETKDEKPKETT
ncbi:hypothetical protein ES702_06178 [subsurface metagenome]